MAVGVLLGLAGSSRAGTIFSFNGVGDPVRRVDARSEGMGGAGRALADGENFSWDNPALLGSFVHSAFSGLYFEERRSLADSQGQHHVVSDGNIGAFRLVVPVRKGTVLGISVEPLTDENFSVSDSAGTGDARYQLVVDASGDIETLSLGLGQHVGKFYVGGRLDLTVLGSIRERWLKHFANPDLGIPVSLSKDGTGTLEDEIVRTHRGVLGALGVVYHPSQAWYVGLNFQPKGTITQTVHLRNDYALANAEPEVTTKRDVKLPAVLGGGIAYSAGYKWKAAFDVQQGYWKNTGPGRFNTLDVSAGVMYRTGVQDPTVRAHRLEFTAGLHYRSLYFPTSSGSQISEKGVSLGIALPFMRFTNGHFRYVIEVGKRGDVNRVGISEGYIRQSFSVAGWLR